MSSRTLNCSARRSRNTGNIVAAHSPVPLSESRNRPLSTRSRPIPRSKSRPAAALRWGRGARCASHSWRTTCLTGSRSQLVGSARAELIRHRYPALWNHRPAVNRVQHEVLRSAVVRPLQQRSWHPRAQRPLVATAATPLPRFFELEPTRLPVVRSYSFTHQQQLQTPPAETASLGSRFVRTCPCRPPDPRGDPGSALHSWRNAFTRPANSRATMNTDKWSTGLSINLRCRVPYRTQFARYTPREVGFAMRDLSD